VFTLEILEWVGPELAASERSDIYRIHSNELFLSTAESAARGADLDILLGGLAFETTAKAASKPSTWPSHSTQARRKQRWLVYLPNVRKLPRHQACIKPCWCKSRGFKPKHYENLNDDISENILHRISAK
jgi:hypothetical protein